MKTAQLQLRLWLWAIGCAGTIILTLVILKSSASSGRETERPTQAGTLGTREAPALRGTADNDPVLPNDAGVGGACIRGFAYLSNGEPAAGAQAVLSADGKPSVITTPQGEFIFDALPRRQVMLTVVSTGGEAARLGVSPALGCAALDVHLAVRGSALSVRTRDTRTGSIVKGAVVTLEGALKRSENTQENGVASFTAIPEGSYVLRATAHGQVSRPEEIYVGESLRNDWTLEFARCR